LPFVSKRLLETNYEGLGESDAKEFEREFNEILNLAIKALEQEPKSEWEHDHEILKAYADGANNVLDKIRAEIDKIYKREGNSFDCLNALDELKEFIDKYKAESEKA
jgi:hypothetical protein